MPRLSESSSLGTRRVPQVVVLLDAEGRILSISSSLAGAAFSGLQSDIDAGLHEQLHRECTSDCRFNDLWKKAWRSLSSMDSVEWEVDDPVIERTLRMNLAKPPTADNVDVDRRRGHALLMMTDITRHRRDYELLVERERALLKMVEEQSANKSRSANDDDASHNMGSLDRHLILAQEMERKRIASELHDGISQSAGVIKYNIEASIERLSRADPSLDLGLLEGVVDQTKSLLEEVRRISSNLAPSMLDDFGICVALRWLCDEFRSETCDIKPECSICVDESELPYEVKIAVFRVAQEALNNISKHASAGMVKVDLSMSGQALQLEVRDNGVGLASGSSSDQHGSGLRNMRERVESTGGEFAIESATGKGTVIRATWHESALQLLADKPVLDGVDSNG